jgi:dihydrofolate reductase
MPKLNVFNSISVDGYFTGLNGDMSWAHRANDDAESAEFVKKNAGSGGMLLFGRVTYEMMVSFWPTPRAMETMPEVAKGMNSAQKVVFSRTLDSVAWNNTRLVKNDMVAEVQKLKSASGPPMTILGSGSIVSQLAEADLIDEYQFMVNPVVLGSGRTMFEGVKSSPKLRLTQTRAFGNTNVLLSYERAT